MRLWGTPRQGLGAAAGRLAVAPPSPGSRRRIPSAARAGARSDRIVTRACLAEDSERT